MYKLGYLRRKRSRGPAASLPDDNERFVLRRCILYTQRIIARHDLKTPAVHEFLIWLLGPEIERAADFLLSKARGERRESLREELAECRIDPSEYERVFIRAVKGGQPGLEKRYLAFCQDRLDERSQRLATRRTSSLEKNATAIQQAFGLSDNELELCLFLFILAECSPAQNFFSHNLE
jgi:hypothetical protein